MIENKEMIDVEGNESSREGENRNEKGIIMKEMLLNKYVPVPLKSFFASDPEMPYTMLDFPGLFVASCQPPVNSTAFLANLQISQTKELQQQQLSLQQSKSTILNSSKSKNRNGQNKNNVDSSLNPSHSSSISTTAAQWRRQKYQQKPPVIQQKKTQEFKQENSSRKNESKQQNQKSEHQEQSSHKKSNQFDKTPQEKEKEEDNLVGESDISVQIQHDKLAVFVTGGMELQHQQMQQQNSDEEVEQQQQQSVGVFVIRRSVFAESKLMTSGKLKDRVWFYEDESGSVQGPYTTIEMDNWYMKGYFDNELKIGFNQQNTKLFFELSALFEPSKSPLNPDIIREVHRFLRDQRHQFPRRARSLNKGRDQNIKKSSRIKAVTTQIVRKKLEKSVIGNSTVEATEAAREEEQEQEERNSVTISDGNQIRSYSLSSSFSPPENKSLWQKEEIRFIQFCRQSHCSNYDSLLKKGMQEQIMEMFVEGCDKSKDPLGNYEFKCRVSVDSTSVATSVTEGSSQRIVSTPASACAESSYQVKRGVNSPQLKRLSETPTATEESETESSNQKSESPSHDRMIHELSFSTVPEVYCRNRRIGSKEEYYF